MKRLCLLLVNMTYMYALSIRIVGAPLHLLPLTLTVTKPVTAFHHPVLPFRSRIAPPY